MIELEPQKNVLGRITKTTPMDMMLAYSCLSPHGRIPLGSLHSFPITAYRYTFLTPLVLLHLSQSTTSHTRNLTLLFPSHSLELSFADVVVYHYIQNTHVIILFFYFLFTTHNPSTRVHYLAHECRDSRTHVSFMHA